MNNGQYRVLVVDDCADNREAVAEILRESGFGVAESADGQGALESMSSFRPHVFVCDLKMPGMDGLELLRELRLTANAHEAIVMTGHESLDSAQKAMELGACGYLTKPVLYQELLSQVDRALDKVKAAEAKERYEEELEQEVKRRTKEQQEALKIMEYQSRRLDSVLQSMDEGLLALDMEDNIMLINNRASQVIGVGFAEGAGMPYQMAVRNRELVRQLGAVLQNRDVSAPGEIIASLEVPGLGPRHYLLRTAPVYGQGNEQIGRIVNFLDRTEKIEADRLRDSFLTVVSHEFRTPINVIMNYVELLRVPARSGAIDAEMYSDMEQASRRLKHLVDDVLAIAVLSDSTTTAEPAKTCVETLVRQEIVRYAFEAREKDVEVDLESRLERRPVETDHRLLAICLRGLLSNAIKYSREGGTVRLRLDTAGEQETRNLTILCIDSGVGMSEKVKSALYQGFRQGEDPMTREHHGIGLGLFLVKRATELLEGSIHIESEEGKGTSVELTIPVA